MPTPTQNISQVLSAYQSALEGKPLGETKQMPQAGEDFGSLVKSAIEEARKIGERSEKLSIDAINDRADITQVVTAVAEAELTLQTVINVRDKVMSAYNDIIRMPV